MVAAAEDPAEFPNPEIDPAVDTLRSDIAEQCLTAEQARAVADEALASLGDGNPPVTTVVDESAECARVDLAIGGMAKVTVFGPTKVD